MRIQRIVLQKGIVKTIPLRTLPTPRFQRQQEQVENPARALGVGIFERVRQRILGVVLDGKRHLLKHPKLGIVVQRIDAFQVLVGGAGGVLRRLLLVVVGRFVVCAPVGGGRLSC